MRHNRDAHCVSENAKQEVAEQAASASSVVDPLIQIIERYACRRINTELSIPTQSLGDTFVLIVEDSRERPEKMSGKGCSIRLRESECKLLDVGNRGHGAL